MRSRFDLVAAIPKGRNAEIRIEVGELNGRRVANVRVWAEPREGGDYVPSRKGITFGIDKLPALIDGLQAAAKAVQATQARPEVVADARTR